MAKFTKLLNSIINCDKINQINIESNKEYVDDNCEKLFQFVKVIIIYDRQLIKIDIDLTNKTQYTSLMYFIADVFDVFYTKAEEILKNLLNKENQTKLNHV